MNIENRQRLAGIIVLAILIALLVPFLFCQKFNLSGNNEETILLPEQEAAESAYATPQSDVENKQVVQEETKFTLPELNPENAVPPAPLASKEQPLPKIDSVTTTAQEIALPPPIVAEEKETKIEQPNVIETETPVIPKSVSVAQKVEKPAQPIPQKIMKKPTANYRFWSVQLGSFADRTRVRKLTDRLQSHGFLTYCQTINTAQGQLIRVSVGKESSKTAAQNLANKLAKRLQINGIVVGSNE